MLGIRLSLLCGALEVSRLRVRAYRVGEWEGRASIQGRAEPSKTLNSLPSHIGSIVVPFWDYLAGF